MSIFSRRRILASSAITFAGAAVLAMPLLQSALAEHWVHVLGVLPYLLILACPLMHLFMHKGHGGHGGHHSHETTKRTLDSGADA
jgi:hypothetical protein